MRVTLRGISKRYGATEALRGVSLVVEGGEVHALVGENGAGKTTLVRVLTGAVQPDSGEVLIDGSSVRLDSPAAAQRLGIRVVHQHVGVVPQLTVAENVFLGRWPTGRFPWWISWRAIRARAGRLLEDLGAGDLPLDRPVARLGLAQRKLVEIARALTVTPRLLIMDEPSAALAREDRDRVLDVVRRLRAEGIAVVYISHELDEVFEIANRITVLRDGAIVGTLTRERAGRAEVVAMMVGRPVASPPRPGGGRRGPEVLAVRRLSAPGRFEDVSFSVAAGEIVGLYGLVGSGRTELARCLFGADRFATGDVRLHGRPFRPRSPREARRAGVALITEDRRRDGLVDCLSVGDNVSLASLEHVSRWGVLRRRYQRGLVQAKVRELRVRPPDIDRPVRTLSGGNQQKVVLAKWLLTRASLLILDEPTTGVDVAAKEEIHAIIANLAADGRAILLISTDLPEVLHLSDRVLVMRRGRLVGEYHRGSVTQADLLARASGL